MEWLTACAVWLVEPLACLLWRCSNYCHARVRRQHTISARHKDHSERGQSLQESKAWSSKTACMLPRSTTGDSQGRKEPAHHLIKHLPLAFCPSSLVATLGAILASPCSRLPLVARKPVAGECPCILLWPCHPASPSSTSAQTRVREADVLEIEHDSTRQ